MTVLVVSDQSGLLLSLGSRIDATGVSPGDVASWLDSQPAPRGAIVDDAGGVSIAREIRDKDPWCPILILVAGEQLPSESELQPLEPVRVLRRPFTTSRLVEHLVSMSAAQESVPDAVPAAAQTAVPSSQQEEVPAEPQIPSQTGSVPARPSTRAGGRSRGRRRRRPPEASPGTLDVVDVDTAISTLLDDDDLPTLTDSAEAIVARLEEAFGAETAIAVLVAEDIGWRVAAGRGLRPNEVRHTIPSDHWLARRVDATETAVIVSGTDVARQELHEVPLIHLDNWLAATVSQGEAMLLLARNGEPAFTLADAVKARDVGLAGMGRLRRATRLQQLARHLSDSLG